MMKLCFLFEYVIVFDVNNWFKSCVFVIFINMSTFLFFLIVSIFFYVEWWKLKFFNVMCFSFDVFFNFFFKSMIDLFVFDVVIFGLYMLCMFIIFEFFVFNFKMKKFVVWWIAFHENKVKFLFTNKQILVIFLSW